ncbi:MAG: TatD family hydrolase [Candidatus Micrarchaeota archaeon]|nr:TatD family hydrolase [Candidatus Micrarchaeota archaeon]
MKVKELQKEKPVDIMVTEMADAHCHLDLIDDPAVIHAAVRYGVHTMVTNGIGTKSNMRALDLADNRHVFAAMGIDPETAMSASEEEVDFNIGMIKSNANKIVAIGEIGLDFKKTDDFKMVALQRTVFGKMLDLALSLDLPVCIHSRDAMDQVFEMLLEKEMERVHLHFFEGSVEQAKKAEKLGYMISIPPLLSSKRFRAAKEMALDNIMAESDAPAAGSTPKDTESAIRIVAEAKGISFEKAAEALTANTKRFFNIKAKSSFMRM